MAGTEAFPDLGAHCSHDDCRLLDFLPFRCDSCNQRFCLEHRSYQAHDCAKQGMKDVAVVICPVCASSVRTVFGEETDLTLEKHMAGSSCDPKNYDKVMRKPKCPVKRCKEVLATTNTYMCKTCKVNVCLKHRFPADHLCGSSSTHHAVKKTEAPHREIVAQSFLNALAQRKGTECGTSSSRMGSISRRGAASSSNLDVH